MNMCAFVIADHRVLRSLLPTPLNPPPVRGTFVVDAPNGRHNGSRCCRCRAGTEIRGIAHKITHRRITVRYFYFLKVPNDLKVLKVFNRHQAEQKPALAFLLVTHPLNPPPVRGTFVADAPNGRRNGCRCCRRRAGTEIGGIAHKNNAPLFYGALFLFP